MEGSKIIEYVRYNSCCGIPVIEHVKKLHDYLNDMGYTGIRGRKPGVHSTLFYTHKYCLVFHDAKSYMPIDLSAEHEKQNRIGAEPQDTWMHEHRGLRARKKFGF